MTKTPAVRDEWLDDVNASASADGAKHLMPRFASIATIAAMLFALPVLGCSTPRPRRLLDLETPMFAWHSESAFCGKLRVVDGAHRLWTENGCEGTTTGFVFTRPVASAKFAAIAKAFAGLPHDVPDCAPGAPAVQIFTSREGSIQKTWRLCVGDNTPIPADFAAVEAAFGALGN